MTHGGATPIREFTPSGNAFTMTSENFSFVTDRLPPHDIAHELAHQAGVTHGRDNLIPRDAQGNAVPNAVTPGQERGADDIMRPRPTANSRLRQEDCAKIRDYIRLNKTCDITAPSGSSVIPD